MLTLLRRAGAPRPPLQRVPEIWRLTRGRGRPGRKGGAHSARPRLGAQEIRIEAEVAPHHAHPAQRRQGMPIDQHVEPPCIAGGEGQACRALGRGPLVSGVQDAVEDDLTRGVLHLDPRIGMRPQHDPRRRPALGTVLDRRRRSA
jgi:hypothetical protein